MSKTIVFVRHGESTHNTGEDHSRNVPLSERGREQCKSISGEYDLVICSTMKRARQTLDESNVTYKKVIFTELCREHLDGSANTLYNGEEVTVENHNQLYARCRAFTKFLDELNEKYPRILVVAHGVFLGSITRKTYYNCEQFKYR
jgi:broad specificity phosphatase PhoE